MSGLPRTTPVCSVPWCRRPSRSRGWCQSHYKRWRRHGSPEAGTAYTGESLSSRIRRFSVTVASGCWEWQLALNHAGYGIIAIRNRSKLAHRIAYEALVGSVPDGLELDHLCKNKRCVNPEHLEPVTRSENVRRRWPDRKARACRS